MNKKLIYLLLIIPFFAIGQSSTGMEMEADYGFRNLSPQTVTNPLYWGTMGSDGTMGRMAYYRPAYGDTGVLTFAGLTTNSSTTINIGACTGWIQDNETNPTSPVSIYVNYAGATNVTVTTVGSGLSSYVMLSSSGVISFQNTFPTSAERKAKLWLGKVGHPTGTITTVGNEPDFITSPLAQYRDLAQAFGYVNNGVFPYANGANLNINITQGTIFGDGINFVTSKTNPDYVTMGPNTAATFMYRTQNGGSTGGVTLIDPTKYDNAGTITTVPSNNNATIQYIYAVPPLGFIIQYGQTVYATFNDAIAAVGKDATVVYPNLINNATLIGVLVTTKDATALNNTAKSLFFRADKLGQLGGATAGTSTATQQTSYNNSTVPQITVTDALGAATFRSGRSVNTSTVVEVQNIAGTTTWSVDGNGNVANNPLITITTSVSITTATTDSSGRTQNGRHVVIDNGVNAINLTCNGGVTTSYGKVGTGAITFVQGSGRTLVQLNGTAILNGAVGSTATLWSNGTTDYLAITNY